MIHFFAEVVYASTYHLAMDVMLNEKSLCQIIDSLDPFETEFINLFKIMAFLNYLLYMFVISNDRCTLNLIVR